MQEQKENGAIVERKAACSLAQAMQRVVFLKLFTVCITWEVGLLSWPNLNTMKEQAYIETKSERKIMLRLF